MAENAEDRNFGKEDEVRVFPMDKVELITIGGAPFGRVTFKSGGVGRLPYSRSQSTGDEGFAKAVACFDLVSHWSRN